MTATFSDNPDFSPSGVFDIDTPRPLVIYKGKFYVLRSYILGFVDNVSCQDPNHAFYILTEPYEVKS